MRVLKRPSPRKSGRLQYLPIPAIPTSPSILTSKGKRGEKVAAIESTESSKMAMDEITVGKTFLTAISTNEVTEDDEEEEG